MSHIQYSPENRDLGYKIWCVALFASFYDKKFSHLLRGFFINGQKLPEYKVEVFYVIFNVQESESTLFNE